VTAPLAEGESVVGDREHRGASFDSVSAEYEAMRPGYPPGVIRLMASVSGLRPETDVLEIGCGTGHATIPLAEYGCTIVGIEPSRRMASLCHRRVRRFPNVDIRNVRLEEFHDPRLFHVIVCASSFHWLDPATRLQTVHDRLRDGGRLVVMTNLNPRGRAGFFARERESYQREMGNRRSYLGRDMDRDMARAQQQVEESPLFTVLRTVRVDWTRTYDRRGYERLLRTFSDFAHLEVDVRERIICRIGRLVEEQPGGLLNRPYRTLLSLVRKREC
jgi:SAM-dependent methyltransferase